MFTLLNPNDKNVLKDSNFAKNAIFYKDMLCFCHAFEALVENKEKLPNFCFKNKDELCLEGLCLLMKMYATEFKFETLKLSLDYLKILYYASASYAEGDRVNPETIIQEFDSYRLASEEYCEKQEQEVLENKKQLNSEKKDFKTKSRKIISFESWSKGLKITAWIVLALSILGIPATVLSYVNFSNSSPLFIATIVLTIVGFIVAVSCFIISKRLTILAEDLIYHVKNLRSTIDVKENEFMQVQAKFYRVFCEKYEYSMYFAELFSRYTKPLEIAEIIEKAKEYKLISYNITYDISRLFKSQQREIDETIEEIERILPAGGFKEDFERIYARIMDQDWMYYNAEIRYHFLKKFSDIAELEHSWKLEFADKKINPFDVDVKGLSREKVAFAKDNDFKLIQSTIADLIQTKYFKSIEDLGFNTGYSVDALRRVKSSYLAHFYNYDALEGEHSLFFDKKGSNKISVKRVPLEKLSRIPTLVGLKLRLIEGTTGLGNSDAKVIKTIASSIFTDYVKEEFENLNFREEDIDYPKFTAKKIEKTDDTIIYYVGDEIKVGYRLK